MSAKTMSNCGIANKYNLEQDREALIQQLLGKRKAVLEKKRQLEAWKSSQTARGKDDSADIIPTPTEIEQDIAIDTIETPHNYQEAPATDMYKKSSNIHQHAASHGITTERHQGTFSRKSLDQVKKQVELERQRDCTFQPKINRKSRKVASSESREERLHRLSAPRNKFWAEKEQEREMREEHKSKSCTFKPKTNNSSNLRGKPRPAWESTVNQAYRNRVPVEERLHTDAIQRWKSREQAQREWNESKVRNLNFKPKVNRISQEICESTDYRPIYERVEDVNRQRQNKITKAKIEAEKENPDLTFHPKVSTTSKRIAKLAMYKEGQVSTNVVERLAIEAQVMSKKKERSMRQHLAEQEKQFQFRPQLSKKTREIVQENPEFSKDFVTRQKEQQHSHKRIHRHNQSKLESSCTFKPSIGNAEEVLVHTRPQRLTETEDERFERLASKEKDRKEKLRTFISNQFYSQFDFQPKINHISKILGKSTGGFEKLYRNDTGRKVRQEKQREAELTERQECTFQPQINKTSSVVDMQKIEKRTYDFADPESVLEKIEFERHQKQMRQEQMRRDKEYEELQGCTFNPEIKSTPVKRSQPIVVRGLGRHLELREMARKKQQELKEREEKVFKRNPKGNSAAYTIPKPFNLSSGNRTKKIKQTSEKENDHQRRKPKPQTLYSQRKASVRRILQS